MQSKDTIYDKERACSEIGQALHDAKRRMLDAFKKGVPLNAAAETFVAETNNAIARAEAKLGTIPDQSADTEAAEPSDNRETTATQDEQDRERREQKIKDLAARSMFNEAETTSREHQIALVTLLDALAEAPEDEREGLLESARDAAFRNAFQLTDEAVSFVIGNKDPADDLTSDCDPVHVPVTGTLGGSGIHTDKTSRLIIGSDEAYTEMDRLIKLVMESGDGDRDGEMALLQLLSHFAPHDRSGFVYIARRAVMRRSVAIVDEAADLLCSREPRLRDEDERTIARMRRSVARSYQQDETEQQLAGAIKSVMDQTDHSDSEREYAANTGLNHDRMRLDEIDQLVTAIIEPGHEDGKRAPALMLLLDELKIDDPLSTAVRAHVTQAAMRDGNTSQPLIARYIDKLRREFVGSPPEHGVQFATVVDDIREDLQKGEAL